MTKPANPEYSGLRCATSANLHFLASPLPTPPLSERQASYRH